MNRNFLHQEEIDELLNSYNKYLELITQDKFPLITTWNGNNLLGHIHKVLDDALSHLKLFCENHDDTIAHFINRYLSNYYGYFKEIMKLLLEGKRNNAYKLLEESVVDHLGLTFTSFSSYSRAITDNKAYRARSINNYFERKINHPDLFHVPYQFRHHIQNNRYSLSGFPCIYLGSSTMCCWEELNRPDINSCFFSKFEISTYRFIDLSIDSDRIKFSLSKILEQLRKVEAPAHEDNVRSFEYLLTDYLKIWPIIFCSSIKVYHKESAFKPEYLFPQLLLEWILQGKFCPFDGIKYKSTKESLLENNGGLDTTGKMINYVIPARKVEFEGFCTEMNRKLLFTEPVNYRILEILNKGMQFGNNVNDWYANSIFGTIENELDSLSLKKCTT